MNTNLWDEKNLIDQLKNSSQNEEKDRCDIILKTERSLKEKILNDTMIKSGIYKIINTVDGKYYVGSSKNIQKRWDEHRRELRLNKHPNDFLQNAWNKHGESNFDFKIIELVKNEELLLVEQKYLDIVKVESEMSYNLNYDARGGELSEYSKQKISKANMGRKITEEIRLKLSESHKGIKLTDDAKLKLRVFNKGKKLSDDHKQKIGLANKGKKYSSEIKKKLSELRKGLYIGKTNPSYDKTIYKFHNLNSNITRICTVYEFYTEFKLSRSSVCNLKKGRIKCYKGWNIIKLNNVEN